MGTCIDWRLGFRQSSFRHITRVPQRTVPDAWARPLVSWHALVPFTFRIQVSHQTQEPPSEFLPAEPGIHQSASRRTSSSPSTSSPYVQGYMVVEGRWLQLTNGNDMGGGQPVRIGPSIADKPNIDQILPDAQKNTR